MFESTPERPAAVSKHRRQASRETFVHEADTVLAEASLSWGGDAAGRHRRTHSRGLILDITSEETAKPDPVAASHAAGGSSAAHKKDDGEAAQRELKHNSHSPEWLRQKFPDYDHYSPNTRGGLMILFGFFLIFSAIGATAFAIDRYLLPGFRYVVWGMALYYVFYSGIRLLVMVEWTIYRSTRRGIQFEPRSSNMRMSRAEHIARLREKIQRSMANRGGAEVGGGEGKTRPKILAVVGFGGGGHEATVKGVRDVMNEALTRKLYSV